MHSPGIIWIIHSQWDHILCVNCLIQVLQTRFLQHMFQTETPELSWLPLLVCGYDRYPCDTGYESNLSGSVINMYFQIQVPSKNSDLTMLQHKLYKVLTVYQN